MSRTINYKEKYEKALKAITELLNKGDREGLTIVAYRKEFEEIFPELNESEKIRKWIINEIKIKHHNLDEDNVDFVDKAIAWLEKVGKDNKFLKSIKVGDIITKSPEGILINLGQSDRALEHHDKVEPKFKVGDCITDGKAKHYVINYKPDNTYQLQAIDGTVFDASNNLVESYYHLWSIEDAKEGDILANDYFICVYKERIAEHVIKVIINYSIKEDVETHYETIGDFDLYPATKAQRDFFLSKILQK